MIIRWKHVLFWTVGLFLFILILGYLNGCHAQPRFSDGTRTVLGGDGIIERDMPPPEKDAAAIDKK